MIPPPPADATDIFSISDQTLAERLQFLKEIGYGNWGSVWLCRPRGEDEPRSARVAVKLVHRSKTPTTAARVRSLWNEMKIVRTLKQNPHPSVVSFHSFIITPSYALITMDYLPELVPVEVPEPKAKEWFRSLLSGIAFLHKHGVVHNDIKPANILLSSEQTPVLVDFGFAEKYDIKGIRAFHSNLTYGTPEYLSPERARGLPHDTRKSDIWALGVTFFEILIGRTPFEQSEGEQFTTKEDLEKYWQRTLRGKWVGSWKMSRGAERLIKRMVQPNADLRCMATDAMTDPYWTHDRATVSSSHKRASSAIDNSSSTILDIISPWTTKHLPPAKIAPKENGPSVKLRLKKSDIGTGLSTHSHTRSQSQSILPVSRAASPKQLEGKPSGSLVRTKSTTLKPKAKENAPGAHIAHALDATTPMRRRLAPIAGSPPTTPASRRAKKENGISFGLSPPPPKVPPKDVAHAVHRRTGALTDVTSRAKNNAAARTDTSADKSTGSVRDRMRDWERERQRLRALELDSAPASRAVTPIEKEDEVAEAEIAAPNQLKLEDVKTSAEMKDSETETKRNNERLSGETRRVRAVYQPLFDHEVRLPRLPGARGALRADGCPDNVLTTPMSPNMDFTLYQDTLPVPDASGSGLSGLGRSLRASIDRSFNQYKMSLSLGFGKRSTQVSPIEDLSLADLQRPQNWEESLHDEANSSLPAVHQALRNDRVGADNRADRMTIWLQNVEKVVEDARQNFTSSSVTHLPPLPLPLAPSRSTSTNQRSQRSNRLPRKILAASEIFSDSSAATSPSPCDTSFLSASVSSNNQILPATARNPHERTLPTIPSEEPSRSSAFGSPTRTRRATIVGMSPEKSRSYSADDVDCGSPSRRKEKSRSQNDLQRAISPVSKLTLELERLALPQPPESRRLSAVVDRDAFLSISMSSHTGEVEVPKTPQTPCIRISTEPLVVPSGVDSLTASPFDVQPYPVRKLNDEPVLDSPTQRRIEGVYDRFLMATTGVKRLGRGYQSDNASPLSNTVSSPAAPVKLPVRLFHTTRRVPMPPPISSDDVRRANSEDQLSPRRIMPPRNRSVDELGVMKPSDSITPSSVQKAQPAVRTMRQAFRAIVTGKTVVKKPSRVH